MMVYDVSEHGVAAGSTEPQTNGIQRLLDACAADGGGTVRFAAGRYVTGSLFVPSSTTIELEAGSRLVGSPNLKDYRPIGKTSENRDTALLYAENAHDITIRGEGTIDGNGDTFFHLDRAHGGGDFDPALTRQGASFADRPDGVAEGPIQYRTANGKAARPGTLILFVNCERVTVRDVRIVGSPNWCLHLAGCRYALLSGLFIQNSMLIPNADCIDIANSKWVTIAGCVLEAGDDGIAIASPCADGYHLASTEHITVSNCHIKSRSAGIRVGYGIEPVRDITVSNVHIYESNRGIGVFVRNGQIVENITFTGITIETRQFSGWWGAAEPIHLSAVGGYEDDGRLGLIRNVRFRDVHATSESGILLFGEDHADGRCHISGIDFEHVRLKVVQGRLNERYGGNIDLRPATDPQRRVFSSDLAGLYARNVERLTLRDVEILLDADLPDYLARGLLASGVRGLELDRFAATRPDGASAETVVVA